MSWVTTMLRSSVGRKPIMAITGFSFCVFLCAHLAGNITIYMGKEYFNNYAEHLHSLKILINVSEVILFSFAILHISTGLILFLENKKSRPIQYTIKTEAGGRTISSKTMPYTGLILLIFISIHLFNFHFVDKTDTTIFNIVHNLFSNVNYVCFYIISTLAISLHVNHGFWSAFQTIGINHKKYNDIIKITGNVFSLVLCIGFGFLPIYLLILS